MQSVTDSQLGGGTLWQEGVHQPQLDGPTGGVGSPTPPSCSLVKENGPAQGPSNNMDTGGPVRSLQSASCYAAKD